MWNDHAHTSVRMQPNFEPKNFGCKICILKQYKVLLQYLKEKEVEEWRQRESVLKKGFFGLCLGAWSNLTMCWSEWGDPGDKLTILIFF